MDITSQEGKKFGRNYRLVVYDPIDIVDSSGKFIPGAIAVRNATTDAVTIEYPLTMWFSMSRGISTGFGTCQISAYNLGNNTRERIFHDPYDIGTFRRVQLYVGYGENLSLIFDGRIMAAYSSHSRTQIITHIKAEEIDPYNPFVSFNMPPGTTKEDVIRKVIENYLVFEDVGIIRVPRETYERGIALSGKAMYVLNKLSGGRAYIETGAINVLQDSDALIGYVPILSSGTGLLGTPKRYEAFLEASVIMEPTLILSQGVELKSTIDPRWNGNYKIMAIRHSGTISGTMGSACTTNLQMRMGEFDGIARIGRNSST